MKLVLGVIDFQRDNGRITNAELAEILEKKYHLQRNFVDMFMQDFKLKVVKEIIMQLRSNGRSSLFKDPGRFSELEELWQQRFIDEELHGIKLKKASLMRNPRKKKRKELANKKSYRRLTRTPFVATGQFRRSFKVWLEE